MYMGIMEFDTPRPNLTVADPFYRHPYGGVARDVWVTADQFARFFEVTQDDLDRMEVNTKWFDILKDGVEILGYKISRWHKNWMQKDTFYRITIIEHRHTRINEIMQIAPYLWTDSMKRVTRSVQELTEVFRKMGESLDPHAN